MSKKIAISVVAVLLGVTGVSSASAHTVLIASSPAKNAVVKSLPASISLSFADPLLTLGKHVINKVVVTDPMKMVISGTANKVKGAVLTNTLSDSMPMSGKYLVSYRVSAEDGHIVTGQFTFTLKN